jgi:hypothetical protein
MLTGTSVSFSEMLHRFFSSICIPPNTQQNLVDHKNFHNVYIQNTPHKQFPIYSLSRKIMCLWRNFMHEPGIKNITWMNYG